MSGESIELLKGYDAKQMQWPASFQEKLDGVPTRIIRRDGKSVPITRQNEILESIPHILPYANMLLKEAGSLVGELYIRGVPFKDISGRVRKLKPDRELKLYVFDADCTAEPGLSYEARRGYIQMLLGKLADHCGVALADLPIHMIPGHIVSSAAEAMESFDALMLANPAAEGAVLHSLAKTFQPGKRCWGTQRIKPVPTIDLRVVGFEEAINAKTGIGNKMVGRINVEFTRLHNGTPRMAHIGVGPGTLSHAERTAIWANPKKYAGRVAEVKYMRDETYEALRQPTFFRWRPDKQEGQSA